MSSEQSTHARKQQDSLTRRVLAQLDPPLALEAHGRAKRPAIASRRGSCSGYLLCKQRDGSGQVRWSTGLSALSPGWRGLVRQTP